MWYYWPMKQSNVDELVLGVVNVSLPYEVDVDRLLRDLVRCAEGDFFPPAHVVSLLTEVPGDVRLRFLVEHGISVELAARFYFKHLDEGYPEGSQTKRWWRLWDPNQKTVH